MPKPGLARQLDAQSKVRADVVVRTGEHPRVSGIPGEKSVLYAAEKPTVR
jgi:hypothetical protein